MKNLRLLLLLLVVLFAVVKAPIWAQSNCATDHTADGDNVSCGPGMVDTDVDTGSSSGAGNDTVTTTDANFNEGDDIYLPRLFTRNGDDSVTVGTSTIDVVNAGSDQDTVNSNGSTIRKLSGSDGNDVINIDQNSQVQNAGGDYGADVGGNDTLNVSNSTVGVVGGDDPENDGISGDDVITITTSTVDDVVAGPGNDSVSINDGTTINNDISGGDGTDTLSFGFTTSSKAEYNDFQQQLNVANPQNGSVTWRGVTYNFNTFEALQNLLKLLQVASGHGSSDSGSGSVPIITDGRLDTNPAALAVTYCSGGEIQVYAADGSGLIVAAHALNLASGANASAANVVISYDAASGNIIVSVNGGAYVFTFPAVVCPG